MKKHHAFGKDILATGTKNIKLLLVFLIIEYAFFNKINQLTFQRKHFEAVVPNTNTANFKIFTWKKNTIPNADSRNDWRKIVKNFHQ